MDKIKNLALVAVATIYVVAFCFFYYHITALEAESHKKGLPPGIYQLNTTEVGMLDFYIHRAYVERIWAKVTSRPYTLQGQEAIFRDWSPNSSWGMPHPYSPAMATVMLPFLWLSPKAAYLLFSVINFAMILLLLHFFVFPRINDFFSLIAVLLIFVSKDSFQTLFLGQTAIVTTAVLALLWTLQTKHGNKASNLPPITTDLIIAVLLFVLSAKPQVGIIGAALMLAVRKWRALNFSILLIVLNFVVLAPYYGGWQNAISDYLHFLRHYYKEAMSPYFDYCFQYHMASNATDLLVTLFSVSDSTASKIFQPLYLFGLFVVAGLTLQSKLSPQRTFQLLLAVFLLSAPYLRFTEDIVLALVVAGQFVFGFQSKKIEALKLLLLFLVVDHFPIFSGNSVILTTAYPAKVLLLGLVAWGWLENRKLLTEKTSA